MIPTLPGITTVAQTITLALSPIFMLTAIGQLLNVLAGRLSRVVDRVRALEQEIHQRGDGDRSRLVWELRLLDRRITIINASLFLAVSSAVMTSLVVALLFVATLAHLHLATLVALLFIVAMLLLIASLAYFMMEVRVSLQAIHVRKDLLDLVSE
ncbi:DUF2721 domain-containing protein [Sphingomonas abaci]|uniref:Uncharacterized membrane protein YciS (DUF1049 family) n=1 Tax=Sphingomonas abaci TaxID=237611 RepID=A0A7W7AHP1_9SPHN|nr:DUF2721 domain-containing protein [Sphingomonas abaci]MBB4617211.1 uncharacterized membrane protein YciS (DUF1049 family) [Sphingomonas abaci]